MGKCVTSTGKSFLCDYFNPCEITKQLNLRVLDATIVQVSEVFSNKAETVQMWCDGVYAANFTRLVAIVPEGDAIRVVLGKE